MKSDLEIRQSNVLPARPIVLTSVFGLTLFLSAGLLFWVQPLIAKMLLPLLGGGPSIWNTCMVFFQASLLAGYSYSLLIAQKFSIRWQIVLHASLLLAAAVVLPFTLSNRFVEYPVQTSPVGWLLITLSVTVGPPFLLLSATAPLLQKWISGTTHKSAGDPYFLYAVSNAGSILALVAFPLLLEPTLTLKIQTRIWAVGYVSLVMLVIACGGFLLRKPTIRTNSEVVSDSTKIFSAGTRLEWTLLALIPSSLMLGVTTFIATDVASVPMIWILPLTLYLVTFILAFATRQIINPTVVSFSLPVALLILGAIQVLSPPISMWVTLALHLLVFFLAALICHQRLARTRPDPARLNEFYFFVALGGVMGGLFNALIAPFIFSTPVEYPIAIVAACLMRPVRSNQQTTRSWLQIVFPGLIFSLTFVLSLMIPRFGFSLIVEHALVLLGPLALCFVVGLTRPLVFGLGLAALFFGSIQYLGTSDQTLLTQRNFFGVWRVTDNSKDRVRRLYHGSTIHGIQLRDRSQRCEATTYYAKTGPLGQVFDVYRSGARPRTLAAIGLGAGTVATYSNQGEQWDFYEIDSAIVEIASNPDLFTFLSDCMRSPYRTILGDARQRLASAPAEYYGLLVMDAFSSDSVPAHLLTSQALDLYLSKLAADGIIAFHISNRYLNLEPLLAGLSRKAGLSAFIRRDREESSKGKYGSTWVAMARNDVALGSIPADPNWAKLNGNVVWTDDFSNIISLLD